MYPKDIYERNKLKDQEKEELKQLKKTARIFEEM